MCRGIKKGTGLGGGKVGALYGRCGGSSCHGEGVGGKASGVALFVCDGFGCWVVGWGSFCLGLLGRGGDVFQVGVLEFGCRVGEKS